MADLTFTLRKNAEGIFVATFKKHGEAKSQKVPLNTTKRDVARRRANKLGDYYGVMERLRADEIQNEES